MIEVFFVGLGPKGIDLKRFPDIKKNKKKRPDEAFVSSFKGLLWLLRNCRTFLFFLLDQN
jgi:hypothetical protein